MLAVDCLEDARGPQLTGFGKKNRQVDRFVTTRAPRIQV
jgi:hypothetical protein